MKKLSLVLGFAFVSVAVFAQNTAVVNQTKDKNKANVTQTGSKNGSQVDQSGTDNSITVDSKGKLNQVTVVQNGSGNGEADSKTSGFVKQSGDANIATLKQGALGAQEANDNNGFINQVGNSNQATLEISGSNNNNSDHGIIQIQSAILGIVGNTAVLKQAASNNDLDVRQEGAGNSILGTSIGGGNQFYVGQTGVDNRTTINQLGSNNGDKAVGFDIATTGASWNRVTQTGDRNNSILTQGSNDQFKTEQYGNDNKSNINQTGNNMITTYQAGNSNTVGGILNFVPQDEALFVAGASMNATQMGDNNKLYVSTLGSLKVNQNNLNAGTTGNTIKYTQTSTGAADLTQEGDNNLVFLKTTTAGLINLDQNGTSNGIALYASGSTSAATGSALFEGTHLNVEQSGSNNLMNLNSTGANASVDVTQIGASNWASVVQSVGL